MTSEIGSSTITQMTDLSGRTAIVTGGALGIGLGIVRRLAEAGAAVVVADADLGAAEKAAEDLTRQGLDVLAMRANVADEDDVHSLVADTVGWRGKLDVLVNNAGIYPQQPVLDMTYADFERVIRVNLTGTFLCSREAALRMRHNDAGGRIINITSIDALHPSAVGLAHYDASKHGVWGFTRNLALELAPHRIQVNAIAPGAVATPGVARQTGADPAATLAAFVERVPMGRIGVPDDIARAALFLASDLASYITGAQLVVDGGFLLR